MKFFAALVVAATVLAIPSSASAGWIFNRQPRSSCPGGSCAAAPQSARYAPGVEVRTLPTESVETPPSVVWTPIQPARGSSPRVVTGQPREVCGPNGCQTVYYYYR